MNIVKFNGKNILYIYIDGVCWLAVKPICEALGVNFDRQIRRLKEHRVFGPATSVQTLQVPGDQSRKMVCLPEEFIYGWLFSINSHSEQLIKYQAECNHILYNHFHGAITRRSRLYSELSNERARISELEGLLAHDDVFNAWMDSKMRAARLWKNIKETSEASAELLFE